jgi:hypothetical protein
MSLSDSEAAFLIGFGAFFSAFMEYIYDYGSTTTMGGLMSVFATLGIITIAIIPPTFLVWLYYRRPKV